MCDESLIKSNSTDKSLALHYISLKENVGGGGRKTREKKPTTLDFPPKLNFQAMFLVTFKAINATYQIYIFNQTDIPLPQETVRS